MADDRQQSLAEVPLLYANSLRLGIAFTDIRLYFGEGIPSAPPADLKLGETRMASITQQIDRLCVVMTPDLLPSVIDGLQKALQFYQAQFGALRTPPPQVTAQLPPPKQ